MNLSDKHSADYDALAAAMERLCVAAERSGVWGGIDPSDVRAEIARSRVTTPEKRDE